MLRVHYREGGGRFSWLAMKAVIRPWIYAWMPLKLRLWVRKVQAKGLADIQPIVIPSKDG
jgi:hypothetical protein